MFLIAFVTLLCLLVAFIVLKVREKNNSIRSVTGEVCPGKWNPFDFMFLMHDNLSQGEKIIQFKKQYGNVFTSWFLFKKMVILTTPEGAKGVLHSSVDDHFDRIQFQGDLLGENLLGESLIRKDGENWRNQRAVLIPAFNYSHLKTVTDVFGKTIEKMVEAWIKDVDSKKKSNPIVVIDVQDWMTRLTLDVIGSAGFGFDFGALNAKLSAYHDTYDTLIKYILNPLRFFVPFYDRLPLPSITKAHKSVIDMQALLNQVVDKKKNENLGKNEDILDMMINSQQNTTTTDVVEDEQDKHDEITDTYKHKKKEPLHMSDVQLKHNLMLFFIAGHETSASALTWAMYELSRNPEIQQKAREEVYKVVGKDKILDWDDLTKLEYISNVLKETLRLWNPAPGVVRTLNSDLVIENYNVPKGTLVLASFHAIHRDPNVWPDPEKFDPDRFAGDKMSKQHPYAFLPFSAGPRSCIGNKFSLLEMKLTLAMIVQKFRFEPDPDFKLEVGRNITMRPKNNLTLRVNLV